MGKTYVIYPGRFQPMGKHHVEVYNRLKKEFGDDVYIATSDSRNPKTNPLGFDQKKIIATKMGIPPNKIFKCDQPYHIQATAESLSKALNTSLNPEEDVMVYVYGYKDTGRLSFLNSDGTPGVFQAYVKGNTKPFSKHAYVYITPTVEIEFNGRPLSGTVLRDYLRQADKIQFEKTMGFYDPDIHQTLQHTLPIQEKKEVESAVTQSTDSKFDRVAYYKQYIDNILPKGLSSSIEDKKIIITVK